MEISFPGLNTKRLTTKKDEVCLETDIGFSEAGFRATGRLIFRAGAILTGID
jgi:hypothetical protein